VAVVESYLRFVNYVASQARAEAANPACGFVAALISLLPRLPTPNSVRQALSALEPLSRTEAGLAAINQPDALAAIVLATSTVFTYPTDSGAATRQDRVAAARSPAAAGGTSAATANSAAANARINGHLDPAFRLLDRVSRSDSGLKALRASQAASSMAQAVEFAQVTSSQSLTICSPSNCI
jgi:hypothetical protein